MRLHAKRNHVQGHPEEVYGCEFLDASAGSAHLASCSAERVYLWDIATGRLLDSAGPPLDIRHEPAGGCASPQPAACLISNSTTCNAKLVHRPPFDIARPAFAIGCAALHILLGGSWPTHDLNLAVVFCT